MTIDRSSNYDDEIDLRAIALTLWKARTVIFVVTIVAALAAFAVSYWGLPRTYQANAYVFIGQPVLGFTGASGIKISPTLPDLNAVAKLAVAPGLLDTVLKDAVVIAALGDNKISMSGMVTAVVVGKDQISLQVTDTDPQRAALLANGWAEKVVENVNEIYGMGNIAQLLDSQVLASQHDLVQAQTALEDALSKSQVAVLDAQLQRKQADLKCVLDSSSQITRVLDDLQVLEQGLSVLPAESLISFDDGLVLTLLRQDSLTSQSCQLLNQSQPQPQPQPQYISVSVINTSGLSAQFDNTPFAVATVSKALGSVTQLRSGLQSQLTNLQNDQSRLEQDIPQLQKDLENAQAQMGQFTLKRDQSRDLYSALLQSQQQVSNTLKETGKVAILSVMATPPENPASRKTLMNTALAGMLGLMLSAFGVLAVNWMKNE